MGGSGGGNNSSMLMTILMMQQMQQQAEAQQRQLAAQQAANEKRYADSSRQRYNTLLDKQNKTVGDMYASYNKNIDDIMAINPEFNSGTKLDWTQYDYEKPQGFDTADVNQVDNWYSDLDKKSYADEQAFKKTLDKSNVWLNAAKQRQDILGRNLPGTPVNGWSGGGQQVSGNAGADSLTGQNQTSGTGVGAQGANTDVYNNLAGAAATPPSAGTGLVGGAGAPRTQSPSSALSGMFSSAVSKPKSGNSYSMF